MTIKGIILAGGAGTRLYPLTKSISKHLLPIYDKPLIYYPLSVLMLSGIRDILIISTPDLPYTKNSLRRISRSSLPFVCDQRPRGWLTPLSSGNHLSGKERVALILGDNIFYGQHFQKYSVKAAAAKQRRKSSGYYVRDPAAFGVVEFDQDGNVLSIVEKPKKPRSHYAVPGLYYYDNDVVAIAKSLKPSARGEIEITDVNNIYLSNGTLLVELFGRGMAWLDSGTHDSLLEAAQFIETIQKRQGFYVACIEEIAFQLGYINKNQLLELAQCLDKTEYGQYLIGLASENGTI